jgi:hypothetical protein
MRNAVLFGALAVSTLAFFGSRSPGAGGRVAPSAALPVATDGALVRPTRPPGPDDPMPARPPEPALPVQTPEMREAIVASARGSSRPGQAAFRTFTDAYVDANLDFAEEQAASEGVTVAEVRELTHFGLLVLATQRVSDVEQMVGGELSSGQREALATLMTSANERFKQDIRALVASGASEEERWTLIRETEATYLASFYAATGMTEVLLDDLLAGNMMLPGAPVATDLPADPSPPSPADQVDPPPRP